MFARKCQNMNTLQLEDDKKEDRRTVGYNSELNINDCSPLRTYSNFKNDIFPHPEQRRPQGRKSFPAIIC